MNETKILQKIGLYAMITVGLFWILMEDVGNLNPVLDREKVLHYVIVSVFASAAILLYIFSLIDINKEMLEYSRKGRLHLLNSDYYRLSFEILAPSLLYICIGLVTENVLFSIIMIFVLLCHVIIIKRNYRINESNNNN